MKEFYGIMHDRKKHKKYPTIGLLVDWAGNSYGIKIWNGASDFALAHNANLICFIGGALNTPYRHERQRNSLYELINADNIDGLIICTSLISHYVSESELQEFCSRFKPLPLISIGKQLEGISSLIIDNVCGMKEIMNHLIAIHGYKRIAFINGPEERKDALERFLVYKEILANNGLDFDPELIVPGDYCMTAGQTAVQVLFEERGLGIDAIVAANDAMASGAIAALRERDIHVPGDIAVVGFDDIEADHTFAPSLTTVRQPLYEVGSKAAHIILNAIEGNVGYVHETFRTELIIRESCGCFSPILSYSGPQNKKTRKPLPEIEQRHDFLNEMNKILVPSLIKFYDYDYAKLEITIEHLLKSFYSELLGKKTGAFITAWNEILLEAIQAGNRIGAWRELLSLLHRYGLVLIQDEDVRKKATQLIHRAKEIIADTEDKVSQYKRLRTAKETMAVQAIGEELFTTVGLSELVELLERNFPRLGIKSCYLSLTEEEEYLDGCSRAILAFNENGRIDLGEEGIIYPSTKLAPKKLLPSNRCYSMMVEALYQKDKQRAILMLEIPPQEGVVYKILSRRLGSALKGVLLLHQIQRQTKILALTNKKLKQEIIDRKRAETALRESEKRLRAIIEANPIPLVIYRESDEKILYTNKYFHITFGTNFALLKNRTISDFFNDPQDTAQLHKELKNTYFNQQRFIRNTEFCMKKDDGSLFWVVISVETLIFNGESAIIAGFYDITDRKRLEKEILEISGREQHRIGQELHDGLGQQLSGIALMCQALQDDLKNGNASLKKDMEEIINHVHLSLEQTRSLAYGLFPVHLEENGILCALNDLSEKTRNQFRIKCGFEYKGDVAIKDNSVALHLFRIAQEAVHNAVKHAHPHNISIELSRKNGRISLSVKDDGKGFPDSIDSKGMGLKIMRYRANIIGGKLYIQSKNHTGTLVTCTIDTDQPLSK
ncbi:MAG: substrate-binding domain-containing protein [Spirochaetales bacterium]|nr:substrate-binding domain-containing protein [Spirochaetales bacterium]